MREGRESGSARGQMQECAAGKFHGLPLCNVGDALFRLDVRRLDDRPPFLDLGLLIGTKRLRRLPLALRNFKALLGSPNVLTAAVLSLLMMSFGVPLGANRPAQSEK